MESVPGEHPDVAEAAVVGVPDELRGEVIEAFVALRSGADASDALIAELQLQLDELADLDVGAAAARLKP